MWMRIKSHSHNFDASLLNTRRPTFGAAFFRPQYKDFTPANSRIDRLMADD